MEKTTLVLIPSQTGTVFSKFAVSSELAAMDGEWLIWGPDQMDHKLRWKCIRTGASALSGKTNWKEIVSTFSR